MTRSSARFRCMAAVPVMLAVASCSAIPTPEAPAPVPAPVAAAPTPAPAPAPAASARPWDERTLDSGAWRYDGGSRTASFIPASGGAPLLSMACSGGGIRLTSALAGDVSLRTTAGTDAIRFDGGGANMGNRDPRLDRIAFSRGRFALEGPGGALTLPVQSEIGRVIEDCRG